MFYKSRAHFIINIVVTLAIVLTPLLSILNHQTVLAEPLENRPSLPTPYQGRQTSTCGTSARSVSLTVTGENDATGANSNFSNVVSQNNGYSNVATIGITRIGGPISKPLLHPIQVSDDVSMPDPINDLHQTGSGAQELNSAVDDREDQRLVLNSRSNWKPLEQVTSADEVQLIPSLQLTIPMTYGQIVTGSILTVGQVVSYTFTAEAGDVVLIGMGKVSGSFWQGISLYDPDGNLLNETSSPSHAELTKTLSVSGTYTILAYDGYNGTWTGSYALYLQRLNNPADAAILLFSGQVVTGTINDIFDFDTYTFVADEGSYFYIETNRLSGGLDPEVRLFGPDGNLFASAWDYTQVVISGTIANAGSHTLLVGDYGGTETGTYSMTITLSGPVSVILGEMHTSQIHQTESQFYVLEAPTNGEQLLVEVTPLTGSHHLWVEGKFGAVPFGGNYDLHSREQTPRGTYELLFAPSRAGTYYFSVFGREINPSPGSYKITVRTVERHLSNLTPRTGGNTGEVTLNVSGLGFVDGVQVALRSSGLPTLTATEVTIASTTQLWAHFDLNGTAAAVYDLAAIWPDSSEETLTNAFDVVSGEGPRLEAHILVPDTIRLNRKYVLWIEYANLGDSDMLAPLLIVSSPQQGVGLSLSPDGTFTKQSVQILGINFDQPAGNLPPGSNHRIPVYFQVTEPGTVHFYLDKMVADATLIDWNVVEAELRPENADPEIWDAMFTQ